jgi:aryl-alcohol dehydrogenase-like predicted oxidoreductase
MRYRRLGSSELVVSEIALGSWLTFGHGVDREASLACVDRALGLGVNLIDTANVYGRGAAEELLGEALASRPRSSYMLARGARAGGGLVGAGPVRPARGRR